jgi:hypothetical protein
MTACRLCSHPARDAIRSSWGIKHVLSHHDSFHTVVTGELTHHPAAHVQGVALCPTPLLFIVGHASTELKIGVMVHPQKRCRPACLSKLQACSRAGMSSPCGKASHVIDWLLCSHIMCNPMRSIVPTISNHPSGCSDMVQTVPILASALAALRCGCRAIGDVKVLLLREAKLGLEFR